jgi:hypothetical protein
MSLDSLTCDRVVDEADMDGRLCRSFRRNPGVTLAVCLTCSAVELQTMFEFNVPVRRFRDGFARRCLRYICHRLCSFSDFWING